jgi:hypothetical protein
MSKNKKGEHIECVGLAGTCNHCKEAVRFIITKAEVKILLKSFKIPQNQRNLFVEKELEKLKRRGVVI